ncbi:hypothetical protein QBC46DRAFT_388908 [Diplogelasinospora grovesii]|uniref:Uncharacterized protein n=1 Tax=Diplogelasinospora grovesii TaxID=303347 RepID=A0AAN6N4Q4_9PEZI|nr:hypothetical protein QBC46DRAFT_388908 [Diplogelasinospora grovesii]
MTGHNLAPRTRAIAVSSLLPLIVILINYLERGALCSGHCCHVSASGFGLPGVCYDAYVLICPRGMELSSVMLTIVDHAAHNLTDLKEELTMVFLVANRREVSDG